MLLDRDQTAELPSPVGPSVRPNHNTIREPAPPNGTGRPSGQTVLQLPAGMILASGEQELFNHVNPNDFMWTGHGARSVSRMIVFQRPFRDKPDVTYGLSSFDCSKAQNLRYRVDVGRTGQQGFRITLHIWGDTKIARCTIRWQAIGVG
ncbi:H-type lectin domain-containing protein [Neptunicoccus cionae]|uniref:H-type lectin domain-containing protein n=1 Tax=Neptunicoccus cionae TaxID=2035344 RepID=A0A916QVD7_9RHOB|nr:H-type lectin domain-containing protein [Amylibacter cionae]GGA12768.1 hypothetical protein GCM10011498_10840 [Amylibacter cionae]